MSVVCAKVYKDKIVMAADSIIAQGWSKRNTDFVKLARINDMIVGSVGWCNENSLMWHYMRTHKPSCADEKSVLDFIVEFTRWKKELTNDYEVKNNYLMAYEGCLFEIENTFVHEVNSFISIGAGKDFASAALYLGHTPREAVKVACELCCMVTEPIVEEEMAK